MNSDVEKFFEDVAQELHCEQDNEAVLFTIARWREALEIIAGERQCIDNLLGNKDVARIALHGK
jgi:hypothetical protein